MFRRITTVLVAAAVLLAAPAAASAATTNQIMSDFRKDQSIDGDYTVSELRAANASIDSAQREYFDTWEVAYRAALRRALAPPEVKAVPVVKPTDTNNNGKIDVAEVEAAVEATEKKQEEETGISTDLDIEEPPTAEPADPDDSGPASDQDDDDSSTPWGLIVILIAMALVAGIGIWRTVRERRRASKLDDASVSDTTPMTWQGRPRPRGDRKPGDKP